MCFFPYLILLLLQSVPLILWAYKTPLLEHRPSFLQNYPSFAPPGATGNELRVAFYASVYLLAPATVLPAFFDRLDVAALDLFGVYLFGK